MRVRKHFADKLANLKEQLERSKDRFVVASGDLTVSFCRHYLNGVLDFLHHEWETLDKRSLSCGNCSILSFHSDRDCPTPEHALLLTKVMLREPGGLPGLARVIMQEGCDPNRCKPVFCLSHKRH